MTVPAATKRWKRQWENPWFRRTVIAILFTAVFFGLRAWQQRMLVEGPAPVLSATSLNAGHLTLAGAGQPTLVYFWGSWCGICRIKEGDMESLARDHRVISVILTSGNDNEVRGYLKERGLKLPVINDPDGTISREWGVIGTPTVFIVDTGNRIRFREVGYTTEWGLRFRLWLAGL